MDETLFKVVSMILSFAVGFIAKKMISIKNDENRYTIMETSIAEIKLDLSEIKKNNNMCNKHNEDITVLKSEHDNYLRDKTNTDHDIKRLYDITGDIKDDISEVNKNVGILMSKTDDRDKQLFNINNNISILASSINKLIEKNIEV